MLKKTLLIGLPALAVALLIAVVVVLPRLKDSSTIETKAIGIWQETDSPQAYRLEIRRDLDGGAGVRYTVTYPRSFLVPFSAFLADDEIRIWGENTGDIVWVVTYDVKTDTLTLTRPRGSEPHTLRRLAD